MAQRAMIAAMLASSPDLLIPDEPTNALDVIVREQVLRLIDQLIAEEGLASSSSATICRWWRASANAFLSCIAAAWSITGQAWRSYTRELLAASVGR